MSRIAAAAQEQRLPSPRVSLSLRARELNDVRTTPELQGNVREIRRDATDPALLRIYRAVAARPRGARALLRAARMRADDADPARAQIRLCAGGYPPVAADL